MKKIIYKEKEVTIKCNRETGLLAIVAIDSDYNSIGLGGTRCLQYSSFEAAMDDAVSLASCMSKKIAFCSLDYTGAKGVLLRPNKIPCLKAYFKSYGEFINELKGSFITGCDSGVDFEDMKIVSSVSPYITAVSPGSSNRDNLAFLTAYGVSVAMEEACFHRFQTRSLQDVHICVQGLGKVGTELVKLLIQSGAKLSVTDIHKKHLQNFIDLPNVTYVSPDDIFQTNCDIFSPCALGGVIHERNIEKMNFEIICGAANNPLESDQVAEKLHKKDILYIPDYLANLGGTMYAADNYLSIGFQSIKEKICNTIRNRAYQILELSRQEKRSVLSISESLLKEIRSR